MKFDFNNIKYKNKEKEESRQGKLAEFRETGKWPGLKTKQVESVAWSKKLEKKERKEKRKRIKEMKRSAKEEDDDDDLDDDYRLLKKMRKNNSAAEEFDRQIELDNIEEEDDN